MPSGSDMVAVGDSVMLASAPELQREFPGVVIDATVARQMREAPAILRKLEDTNTLRSTLVIGLGTNGAISNHTLDEIHEIAGPSRDIVLVNASAPREWTDTVDNQLAELAHREKNVGLCDWRTAITAKPELLASDGIHPRPGGGAIYAECIRDALERLTTSNDSDSARTAHHDTD